MATNMTNFFIGGLLFLLVMSSGLALLANYSNVYQVPLDNNFSEFTTDVNTGISYTGVYNNVSQGASIDAQSLGSAQLQGLISAEKTKTNMFTLLGSTIQQGFKYYPVTATTITILSAIISVLAISAFYQAFRGFRP